MDRVSQEEILESLNKLGPSIPLDIKRDIGKGDTFVIGAALSELIKQKKVLFTNVKKGSSPFYFIQGQDITSLNSYLGEKDKRAYDLLVQKKILRDSKQEPLTRVALRNIPDFAKKILINVNKEKEIFWKYFKLSDNEALQLLRETYKKPSADSNNNNLQISKKENTSQNKSVQDSDNNLIKNKQTKISQNNLDNKTEELTNQNMENIQKSLKSEKLKEHKSSTQDSNSQSLFKESHKRSDFESFIYEYFKKNNVHVKKYVELRANSEYEFFISMDTSLGKSDFYCKAKKKKKCNELDLSDALLQATINRLPGVFLIKGDLTNKAKEKLKEDFKGLIVIEF